MQETHGHPAAIAKICKASTYHTGKRKTVRERRTEGMGGVGGGGRIDVLPVKNVPVPEDQSS